MPGPPSSSFVIAFFTAAALAIAIVALAIAATPRSTATTPSVPLFLRNGSASWDLFYFPLCGIAENAFTSNISASYDATGHVVVWSITMDAAVNFSKTGCSLIAAAANISPEFDEIPPAPGLVCSTTAGTATSPSGVVLFRVCATTTLVARLTITPIENNTFTSDPNRLYSPNGWSIAYLVD